MACSKTDNETAFLKVKQQIIVLFTITVCSMKNFKYSAANWTYLGIYTVYMYNLNGSVAFHFDKCIIACTELNKL